MQTKYILSALWILNLFWFFLLFPFFGWIGWATVLIGWSIPATLIGWVTITWFRRHYNYEKKFYDCPFVKRWSALILFGLLLQVFLTVTNDSLSMPSALQTILFCIIWGIMILGLLGILAITIFSIGSLLNERIYYGSHNPFWHGIRKCICGIS